MKDMTPEIDIPDKAVDPLAAICCQRWNEAVFWRSSERIGGKSLTRVLNECFEQREGILSSEDAEMVEELGADVYVNLSSLKVSALVAWMRDLLINTADLPFVLTPSPIPELSRNMKLEVLNQVKQQIYTQGFSGDLLSMVKEMKFQQLQMEQDKALAASDNMYNLIKKQCTEGNFSSAMLKMINDFAVYPFAALHGPVPTVVTRMEWRGNQFVPKKDIQFQFRPLSVFDVMWTADSCDAQSGTAVMIRERITKQELYNCLKIKSYIKDNVYKVIEDISNERISTSWMSRNREQPQPFAYGWGNGETVEVLRHYGLVSGRELMKYGLSGLDAHDYYETNIAVVGQHTIQVIINSNPGVNIRPVYLASFEQGGDRIPGFSVCQKIRDVEKCYLQTLRYMMVNMSFSAGPIGEVDYSRVQQYMTPEEIGRLSALTLYPVDPDMSAGGRPAHQFFSIPANAGAFMSIAQFFSDLADRITQLPAAIHGEPVGTGANRTFRGMAMLYGNAIKPVQSAIQNLDQFVFGPVGTLMYNYNMQYSKDESVKGDATVTAQGSTGLIQKEVAKQTAMDTLQIIATAGNAAQGAITPATFKWAIDTLLRASGVPEEVIEGNDAATQQQPSQGVSQGMPQQTPPGASQNSTPALPQMQPQPDTGEQQ